jgi:Plasmid stabilization system protein
MSFKTVLSKQTKKDIRKLYKYLSVRNISATERLIKSIFDRILLLEKNPQIAPFELFIDSDIEYRSLVVSHYKIIFLVDNDIITIVTIWDCRQNPYKLIKLLKRI